MLALLLGLAGLVLSAQELLPDLAYLLPFSKFSLSINQLQGADLGLDLLDWGKFLLSSLLLFLLFFHLQEKFLKKMIS